MLSGGQIQAETLQEVIGTIIQTNPEVRANAYNRLGRDEEVRQAKSGYLPELNFTAEYGVQDIQEPESDSLNPQQFIISLRQNLFTGLATQNEVGRQ